MVKILIIPQLLPTMNRGIVKGELYRGQLRNNGQLPIFVITAHLLTVSLFEIKYDQDALFALVKATHCPGC